VNVSLTRSRPLREPNLGGSCMACGSVMRA
jgi:hypothetical protein